MSTFKGRIAILWDIKAKLSPSNTVAIDKFVNAGKKLGYEVDIITRKSIHRLHDYDILFIREITELDNHVYLMARIAKHIGIVVIDDPKSIEICCDKARQFKLFNANNIPVPQTVVVTKDNIFQPTNLFNPPYIVKNPYGCFSNGVFKVTGIGEYHRFALMMLEKLDKIVVQEFIATDFDWRIGIMDKRVLFSCKYYMTPNYWKTVKHDNKGNFVEGESKAIHFNDIPQAVLDTSLKAANLIGNGLYGVDIKEMSDGTVRVLEVNDNPNIDAGIEDEIEADELYEDIMISLIQRHEAQIALR